jgi:hypothetical protein
MAKQTLIFVLLPNGATASKALRLSILLTPRLEQGGTLAAFPDILHWPARIKASGLKFEVACGPRTVTVTADRPVLRPDLWEELFKPSTYVEPFKIPDYDRRLIVSYPVRDALQYLKYAYQVMGTNGFSGAEGRVLLTLLRELAFRDGKESVLEPALSQQRLAIWREQQAAEGPSADATATRLPPDGVPTTLTGPPNTRDMITRFALFHHMPPAPHRPPLPRTEADFAKTLDFHRALTALYSYPSLLRALGLVFDVEIPESLCPASPHSGAYPTIALRAVSAGFKWSLAPSFHLPSTAYFRDAKTFRAAPATPAADLSAKDYRSGDVIDGLLVLSPAGFNLVQVDLDGGLLKALSLADGAAFAGAIGDLSVVEDALPSLRSGGIALAASGRALQLLQSIRSNVAFNQALQENRQAPRPFIATDLVRGYRIDIWSSRSNRWFSLHRRDATYRFGAESHLAFGARDEEGFTQLAALQPAEDPKRKPDPVATAHHIPQPGTDLYLHERVARWDGWSLSVRRPGTPLNRSPDPALATTPDPTLDQPLTPFKMLASFTATAGSLPTLRFGMSYRLRARVVDLAGNSVPLDSPTPPAFALPAVGTELTYLRFEPIPPPVVVLRNRPQPGGSLERVVIRSRNASEALDGIVTPDSDERHVGPPRASVRLCEQHGMFDDAQGKLRGDRATYDLITSRDRSEFTTQGGMPMVPGPDLPVSYLPDPLARGAVLRDLPGAPDDTSGRAHGNGLRYATLPDVQPRAGSVTYVDFGPSWPGRLAFRLVLLEGDRPPRWEAAIRVLTVYLPKAATVQISLSCYLDPPDLSIMGVWGWLRELFEARQLAAAEDPSASTSVNVVSDAVALITRLALEGGHEMITPARTLTLMHAVQQPLCRPAFVQLPTIHRPQHPFLASALRNRFTPITAWRSYGSHYTVLLGGLEVHGRSSAKIDLEARWLEEIDDPAQPGPVKTWATDHVETITLADLSGGEIPADGSEKRYVAVYISQTDTLWFAAPFDELAGVEKPGDIAAPVHRFSDTKHRWVFYQAVATSRFREYFPQKGTTFTRSSDPLMVDIPSSARPVAPDIAYVVPTFGWEEQETTNVKTSVRFR